MRWIALQEQAIAGSAQQHEKFKEDLAQLKRICTDAYSTEEELWEFFLYYDHPWISLIRYLLDNNLVTIFANSMWGNSPYCVVPLLFYITGYPNDGTKEEQYAIMNAFFSKDKI
jgi:hypothetical protein